MRIYANLFPEGKKAALTMSYDDGCIHDKRLVDIFNKKTVSREPSVTKCGMRPTSKYTTM